MLKKICYNRRVPWPSGLDTGTRRRRCRERRQSMPLNNTPGSSITVVAEAGLQALLDYPILAVLNGNN